MTLNESNKSPWKNYAYAVIDLEGTGAQHREAEGIVDICIVPIDEGRVGEPSFQALLDPEIEIPAIVSRIHGITNADVAGRPTIADVKDQIVDAIKNRVLVAHNAPIEKRVFAYRLPDIDTAGMLDTLKIAKYAIPSLRGYGLDSLIDHFDMEKYVEKMSALSGRHSARLDASVTAFIFQRLVEEYFPSSTSLSELLQISNTSVLPGQSALFG
jgi:DNA polymerase III epsilon subunit-like protein